MPKPTQQNRDSHQPITPGSTQLSVFLTASKVKANPARPRARKDTEGKPSAIEALIGKQVRIRCLQVEPRPEGTRVLDQANTTLQDTTQVKTKV